MTARLRLLPLLSTATSRIAAIGGTLAARRAGNTAEARLTPRPAITEMMTVLLVNTTPPAGMSMPMPESNIFNPEATPTPAANPSAEAIRPTTPASSSTDRVTCRRLAPMARISAISLVRWATRIVKEL